PRAEHGVEDLCPEGTELYAVAFWRRVAAEAADGAWTEETRPVPGMPELPPDVWISLGTAP
ncbi:GNAT family N-acetyltransferase, partial [Streptomyces sp900105755]